LASAPSQQAAGGRLQDYPVDVTAGDLFRHAPPDVAAKWLAAAEGLAALRDDAGIPVQEVVARQIQDLGLSFRMTGDDDERPWPLSPMPLIVGADEWAVVERGLIQRAQLLEQVTADIYGDQHLIRDGHLPAALVTGSQFFARNMVGQRPRGGHYLHVYAVDLARGPRGHWRVLGDRLRLANGIGYALENRLALSRSTGTMLSDIHARRLAQFFSDLRSGIARSCTRENPRIAMLTPGRLNQSYPEQAHLARYLGFPLVEGRDLTVNDDRLYLRTIAGPKRIDAVWRWIDTNALDPLAFNARSEIGVPDLFEAFARGGVELSNWPGAEVLEAPAFAAFLPRLCRVLCREEPVLPNIATWWCGQDREAQIVHSRMDELVLSSAFGQQVEGLPDARPVAFSALSAPARAALVDAMQRRPMDYCGQEIVQLSTTPALIDERFVPRAFTVRAFVARGPDGEWTVMPGGFARLSARGEIMTMLMGEGDLSADVCVVDGAVTKGPALGTLSESPRVRRGGGILASQAADNLFWFARYVERAELTVRVIRAILGSTIEVDAAAGSNPEVIGKLLELLVQWGTISPETAKLPVPQACHAALTEAVLAGGVATIFGRIRSTGLALRDRFTPDFWRIASRPVPVPDSNRPGVLLRAARELVERLSALSGLLSENFVRGPSWRFLDLGRRIERALAVCATVQALAGNGEQIDALGALLDLSDSQITYRARYLTGPRREPVLDLLLLDPDNPRSLAFQARAICTHIEALPSLGEDMLPEPPLLQAHALLEPLQSRTIAAFSNADLATTRSRLLSLSDTIAARYFLQFEKAETPVGAHLLA
jgi:uncharacterized circularly permuted ATP-grasp superfamily protein/uncharacterized alpha-E superfamily protein